MFGASPLKAGSVQWRDALVCAVGVLRRKARRGAHLCCSTPSRYMARHGRITARLDENRREREYLCVPACRYVHRASQIHVCSPLYDAYGAWPLRTGGVRGEGLEQTPGGGGLKTRSAYAEIWRSAWRGGLWRERMKRRRRAVRLEDASLLWRHENGVAALAAQANCNGVKCSL